jgi:hypothetical protein
MAQRDLDVVIGARTDAASFKRAEQKTRSMFARLRGAGEGGPTGLERSQRFLGQVAAVTATVVAVKDAAGILTSASQMFAAKTAEGKGNVEEAAAAWSSAIETLRQGALTGALVSMAEGIESLFGIETLSEVEKKNDEINRKQAAAEIKREAAARRRAALLKQAVDLNVQLFRERETLDVARGGDALEMEIHRIDAARDAQLKKIHLMEKEAEALDNIGEKQDILAQLETARQRAWEVAATKREDAVKKEKERISEKVAAELQTEAMAERLHGKEGKELEKEQIRIEFQKRFKELNKLRFETTDKSERDSLTRAIFAASKRMKDQLAAVDAEKPTKQRPVPIELPQITSGNQIGGFAQAAMAGGEFRIEERKIATATRDNTKDTVAILRELLSISRSTGYLPILN